MSFDFELKSFLRFSKESTFVFNCKHLWTTCHCGYSSFSRFSMCFIFDRLSVTSSSTNFCFSLCSTVHRVIGSPTMPEIEGNNESLDGLFGELGADKSVSPYELALAESVLV